eukprot:CAMPEP_0114235214 /NCGR_PEP_ID=MMETSP0058-20121206/6126_1 /TAXON_ID=36894 /ORGANISM="Pyramimonas parkeae, CCMP726" /LENGTH=416 /DNA_ID=CAMNT_0001346951 /DNA_START=125 /DNA_END=1375 /DNA_ORIENTATION=+
MSLSNEADKALLIPEVYRLRTATNPMSTGITSRCTVGACFGSSNQEGTVRMGGTDCGAPSTSYRPAPAPAPSLLEEVRWDMLQHERRQARVSDPRPWYHRLRGSLVTHIQAVCERFQLQHTTAAIAVLYADRTLQKRRLRDEHLVAVELIGLASVLLAAKFEEMESTVPKLSELICMSRVPWRAPPGWVPTTLEGARAWQKATTQAERNQAHADHLLRQMEASVLLELDWELHHTTSAHFLETYLALSHGATDPNDVVHGRRWSLELLHHLQRHVIHFQTICMQELPLIVAHPPSLLAGSIILAGRYQMQVEPLWPPVLQAVTGYVEQELTTVACQLLSVHMDQQIQAQDRVKISMMESQIGSFPLLEALVPETSATFKHSEQLASATTKSIAVQAFSPSTPLNLMDMVDSSPMQG